MIDAALGYAARGWPVFPLAGKRPLTPNGFKAATLDAAVIRGWWERWPEAGIGIPCGPASGILVVDIDGPAGEETVIGLPPMPRTLTGLTGGGGRHLLYSYPVDERPGNTAGRLGAGVDTRGDGGYIVAPPSVHPDTGALYEWQDEEEPIAFAPEWLLFALRPEQRPAPVPYVPAAGPTNRGRMYGDALLAGVSSDIAGAEQGSRNQRLYAKARRLGELAAACGIGEPHALAVLVGAARAAGLPEREAARTAESGWRRGIEAPVGIPDSADHVTVTIGTTPARGRGSRSVRVAVDGAGVSDDGGEDGGPWVCQRVIELTPGDMPRVLIESESAIAADGAPVYVRGGQLVRVIRHSARTVRDLARPARALGLTPVTEAWLTQHLCGVARWRKPDSRTMLGYREVDCPPDVAKYYLSRVEGWGLPPLVAISGAPTIRPDGSILACAGYDHATGLYLDLGGVEFPPMVESPTRDAARAALAVLREPLAGFPFLAPADEAVALAAILTPLVRHTLKSAPMFAFSAPLMASGKSLLASVVGLVATGHPPTTIGHAVKPEEEVKALSSILMAGDPVIVIDNISRPLESDALCTILTEEVYTARVLGVSRSVSSPTVATWLATGNNLVIEGDMSTRVLRCSLDPQSERPGERRFAMDLHEWIPANRPRLVMAALTIMRAWRLSGDVSQLPVFGRFEEWSAVVRDALVWAGASDPCEVLRDVEGSDPVRAQLREVMAEIRAVFGEREWSARDLASGRDSGYMGSDTPSAALVSALVDACGRGGAVTSFQVARWIKRYVSRIEGGMRIERRGDRDHVATYRLRSIGIEI